MLRPLREPAAHRPTLTLLRFIIGPISALVTGVALVLGAAGTYGHTAADPSRASCLGARATILGTEGADVLRGTRKRDVIAALGGDDRVYGRDGDDVLCGGSGSDLVDGGSGRNRVDGGFGRDRCVRAIHPVGCERPLQMAPAIRGVTLDGELLSLSDFRGRAVLVNVWTSWCSTCQSEAAAYADFKKTHPQIAFVGLDVVDRPDEGRAFVRRYGWDWPSIQDPRRQRAKALGAEFQPHIIAIDAEGRIAGRHAGRGDAVAWERLVRLVLVRLVR